MVNEFLEMFCFHFALARFIVVRLRGSRPMTDAVINDLTDHQSKRVNLTSQASTLRSARVSRRLAEPQLSP